MPPPVGHDVRHIPGPVGVGVLEKLRHRSAHSIHTMNAPTVESLDPRPRNSTLGALTAHRDACRIAGSDRGRPLSRRRDARVEPLGPRPRKSTLGTPGAAPRRACRIAGPRRRPPTPRTATRVSNRSTRDRGNQHSAPQCASNAGRHRARWPACRLDRPLTEQVNTRRHEARCASPALDRGHPHPAPRRAVNRSNLDAGGRASAAPELDRRGDEVARPEPGAAHRRGFRLRRPHR